MPGKMILGQTAEIPGPKKALILPNAEVAATMIKKAKRPLIVVGSEATKVATKDGDLVDSTIRVMKGRKITVVATAHLVAEFRKRKADRILSMPLMNLGDRLRDPHWKGFDGKGRYDLAVFAGLPYYLEWLILSGLKNFARDFKTVSLDRTYQPNASWSMGFMIEKEWKEVMDKIVSSLEEGS
jgi:acetyl-CoA decarbonylase/synthase complex subunit epsilon